MSTNFNDFLNTPDQTHMYDTQDIQNNKIWAALSYLGILFILPLLVNNGKSRYGKFHANQGLILFIACLLSGIACAILALIPILGAFLSLIPTLVVTILMIIGIINGATGKAKELPLIGGLLHVLDK